MPHLTDTKSKQIHESLYNKANIIEVVTRSTYLTKQQQQQQQQLHQLLSSYPALFDGVLKLFAGPKINLELIDNPVPTRHKPYLVPNSQLGIVKQELEHLVCIISVFGKGLTIRMDHWDIYYTKERQ